MSSTADTGWRWTQLGLTLGLGALAAGAWHAEAGDALPVLSASMPDAGDAAANKRRQQALLASLLAAHAPAPGPAIDRGEARARPGKVAGPRPNVQPAAAPSPAVPPSADPLPTEPATTSPAVAVAARQPLALIGSLGAASPSPFDEEVEPAAGITYRRDPLDLPLLEQDRWIEWVLSVVLNAREPSDGVLFIEDPASERLAVELSAAEAWRLLIDPDLVLTFEGVPFYPLDAIEGLEVHIDESTLTATLDVPPEAFELYQVAIEDDTTPSPTPGTGGFFDYDLLLTGGEGASDRVDGLFETGLFADGNVLVGNFRLEDAGDDAELQRLETTLIRDMPHRRASFRAGDSLTVGGAFAQSLRFAGLQYSTNFATDPAFVTFPLPSIGGLAEQDSVVDVLVDNLTRATESVPSGPFAIDNVPVVTGGGEVQLRVTDLLGRERLLTQPYYVSTRLLKDGLSDFSYEIGFERERFGEASFDYGGVLASATHRYGITNAVTGEVHGEAEKDRASLVAGGAILLGPYGLLTGGVGGSIEDEAGTGVLGQIAYEYLGRRLSLGARTRYTSSDFRQAAGDDGGIERVDQFNVGLDALRFGRIGLLLLNRERNDAPDQRSVTASFSLPIGPGSVVVNAARTLRPDDDYAVTAAYSLPLGPDRSLAVTGRGGSQASRGRLQYTRTRGASELGLDYRLAGEVGDDARTVDARADYQTSRAGFSADLERFSGENRFRVGVDGSVAAVGGAVGLTRRIGRSFGLVDLPGFPNVRVYLDNREAGRTDADGRLLLPALRPFEPNRVRLAVEDLPLTAELTTAEASAVPFDRSGLTIDFAIADVQRATVVLLDSADRPLPAGMVLAGEPAGVEAPARVEAPALVEAMVGRDGFTQLTGRLDERVYLVGETDGQSFTCAVPAADADDPLPHLGDVRCAE